MLLKYNNAQGGFSIRKLRPDYTGYCMRVKNESGVTHEVGFVDNMLDVADMLSFGGTDTLTVVIWYNQVDGGIFFSSSTALNEPIIVNSGVLNTREGLPALRFNNASLVTGGFGITDTRSTFVTFDNSGAPLSSYHGVYLYVTSTNQLTNFQQLYLSGGYIKSNYPTNSLDQTAYTHTDNVSQIVAQIKYPTGANYYKNNLTTTPVVGVQNLTDRLWLGSVVNANPMNGNVQEVLVFSDDKTTDVSNIITDTNDYFNKF